MKNAVLSIHTHQHRQTDIHLLFVCVCVRIVWAINSSEKTNQRGHHFIERGNNENCGNTQTHTLKHALIKHGSKN